LKGLLYQYFIFFYPSETREHKTKIVFLHGKTDIKMDFQVKSLKKMDFPSKNR